MVGHQNRLPVKLILGIFISLILSDLQLFFATP